MRRHISFYCEDDRKAIIDPLSVTHIIPIETGVKIYLKGGENIVVQLSLEIVRERIFGSASAMEDGMYQVDRTKGSSGKYLSMRDKDFKRDP